jgi:hypothetical protein
MEKPLITSSTYITLWKSGTWAYQKNIAIMPDHIGFHILGYLFTSLWFAEESANLRNWGRVNKAWHLVAQKHSKTAMKAVVNDTYPWFTTIQKLFQTEHGHWLGRTLFSYQNLCSEYQGDLDTGDTYIAYSENHIFLHLPLGRMWYENTTQQDFHRRCKTHRTAITSYQNEVTRNGGRFIMTGERSSTFFPPLLWHKIESIDTTLIPPLRMHKELNKDLGYRYRMSRYLFKMLEREQEKARIHMLKVISDKYGWSPP